MSPLRLDWALPTKGLTRRVGCSPLHPGPALRSVTARGLLDTVIPPLMTALFDKVDDALYDLADKSTSNDLHTSISTRCGSSANSRNSIQLNFLQLVRQGADQVAAGFLKCDPGSSQTPTVRDFGPGPGMRSSRRSWPSITWSPRQTPAIAAISWR